MLVTDLICGKINKSIPGFASRIPQFPNIWLSLCLLSFSVTPAAPQEMQRVQGHSMLGLLQLETHG